MVEATVQSEGLIDVDHSFKRPDDRRVRLPMEEIDPARIKLLIVDPHGGQYIPSSAKQELSERFPPEFLPKYMALERDAGAFELARRIVREVPNSFSVSVLVKCALIDVDHGQENTLSALLDGINGNVRKILLEFHQRISEAINAIVEKLHPDARIFYIHTMAPRGPDESIAQDDGLNTLIQRYVGSAGKRRGFDIMPAPKDAPDLADGQLKTAIEAVFRDKGINFAINDPYAPEPGHVMTSFMHARPHRVMGINVPKDLLCVTDKNGFMDLTKPVVDPKKVDCMANIIAEALNRVL